ncbi:MAG: sulfate transporter CysZ [Gammaproteobacteria bacterium]|nr:sulfate transporter CysZ [Gammaproteobacteria bacterium]
MHQPLSAIDHLSHGARLIWRPELRLFVLMPMLANILLLGGLCWWALAQLDALDLWLIGWLPSWLEWITGLLWPLAVLTLLLGVALVFNLVGNWIAAPFNGLLAERTEILLRGQAGAELSVKQMAADLPRIMKREWQKLAHFLPKAIGCLLLNFVPVVGTLLAPLAWFVLAAWMAAVQYADYPFDNHRVSFDEMKEALRERRGGALSFGAVVTLLTMVPLVNLVIMPVAVCGATSWWVAQFCPRYGLTAQHSG